MFKKGKVLCDVCKKRVKQLSYLWEIGKKQYHFCGGICCNKWYTKKGL